MRLTRISTILVSTLAILIAMSMSLIASASTDPHIDKPFGLTLKLGDVYIFEKLSSDTYILGMEKNGENYVVLAKIYTTIPPGIKTITNISIPSRACCITVDDKASPSAIAIIYDDTLLVYDIATAKQLHFALKGKPLRIYPIGKKSFIALTDRALIAIRYNNNGWFEERVIVGSLLGERREGRHILDIIPIYREGLNYSYAYVARETAAYTARAQILLLWNNNTLIDNGQLIGLAREKSITMPPAPVLNGTATLSLLPGSYNLTLFLKQGSLCLRGPTIQVSAAPNTILQLGPIIFSNKSITTCPQTIEAQYLVLIGPGFPPKEVILPESTSQKLGNIKLLSAYMMNNYLYVWVSGTDSKIFSNKFTAVLVYDKNTLKPLTSLWRFYDSVEAQYLVPSRDYRLVVFSEKNSVYIALMQGKTYRLAWSLPLQGTIASLSITKYTNNYIVLAASNDNKVQIAIISEAQPPSILSISSNDAPWVTLKGISRGYIVSKPTLYIAASSPKGLTIVTNMDSLVQKHILISNIYDYIVGYATIVAYNPEKKIVKDYIVHANLTYHNTILLSVTEASSNGKAKIPCISYGVVKARIEPLNKELYQTVSVTINCAKTEIKYDDINITLPYVRHNLTLSIIDTYSNTPPLHDLKIIIRSTEKNDTIEITYPAKAKTIVVHGLLPGAYSIKVIDPRGTLYEPKLINISLVKDMTVKIPIDRKPVTVLIRLIPRITSAAKNIQVSDKLNITVYANKKVIFSYIVMAPSKTPLDVSFTTLYRGNAVIEIKDVPPPRQGKFYRDVKKPIYIGTESLSALYSIELQQLEHTVTIHVATPTTKPIKHVLEVYPANSTKPIKIVNSSAPFYTLYLPIGYYCFHVNPLAEYLGFKLYKSVTYCTKITGSPTQTINIEVKKLRVLTNITVVDPLSKKGVIIDNVTLGLDNKTLMTIPPGKPRTVTLPLLVNGSVISLESKHDVYKPLKKKVKPQNKVVVLKIVRKSLKYELTVLSTRGKTLPGALIAIDGMDNVLHLKYTADEKGSISISLPYGTYHVCVSRPGYLAKCYTLSIHASASDVVTLKPTLFTIIRSYIVPITIIVIGVVLVVVTRAYFKRVLERLSEEEF